MKIISCDCCNRILKEDRFQEQKGLWLYSIRGDRAPGDMKDVCKECAAALDSRLEQAQKVGSELYENLFKEAIAFVRRERAQ